jgi:ABC-2 type transport system permease protein
MTARRSTSGEHPPWSAFGKLVLTEAKLTWRTPLGPILGLGLPVLLLVVFANIPAFKEPKPDLGGHTLLSLYAPILSAFSLAWLGLAGLSIPLATYREQGVLRRMSTTPAPPSWVLGAQLLVNLAVATVALLIINLGFMAFGVGGPEEVGGFALSIVLTAAALFAIGLWIAAIARTGQTANGIAQILFYPMMFFAGLYFPREIMPGILRHVSDWTPLGAAVQALQSAAGGSFPPVQSLLVMLGYAVVFGVAAVKQFRWE